MPDFLLFTLDNRRFAIDLARIRRVVRMVEVTPLPKPSANVEGVVNFHGEMVPVFNLRERCGLPPRPPSPADHLIIAKTGRRTVALAVDQAEEVFSTAEADLVRLDRLLAEEESGEMTRVAGGPVFIWDLDRFLTAGEGAIPEGAGDAPV